MLAMTLLFPLGSHLPLGVHPWALRSLKAPAVLSALSPAWGRCWSHPSAPLLGGTEFRDCCAMGLEDAAPLHGLSPMALWGPPVLFWAQFPLQRCQARRTSFFLSCRVPNRPRHECNAFGRAKGARSWPPGSGTVSSVGVTCIFHDLSVFFVGVGRGEGVSNIEPRFVQHHFLISKRSMFDGTNLHLLAVNT